MRRLAPLILLLGAGCTTHYIADFYPTADGGVLIAGRTQDAFDGGVPKYHTILCELDVEDRQAPRLDNCASVDIDDVWDEMRGRPTKTASSRPTPSKARVEGGVMGGLACDSEGAKACGTTSDNVYECRSGRWRVLRTCSQCVDDGDEAACR